MSQRPVSSLVNPIIERVKNRQANGLRLDIFDLHMEDAAKVLSSKKYDKSVYAWLMEVLFDRTLLDDEQMVNMGSRTVTLEVYIDSINDILWYIQGTDRIKEFVRSFIFIPVYSYGSQMFDSVEDVIDRHKYRGILFNPRVSVEMTQYAMSIVRIPLSDRSLFMFIPTRSYSTDEIAKIGLLLSRDVTGKCITYLMTTLVQHMSNEWWTSDVRRFVHLTVLLRQCWTIRQAASRSDSTYFIMPTSTCEYVFNELIVPYLKITTRDRCMDRKVVDLIQVLIDTNVRYTLSPSLVKIAVTMGLEAIDYYDERFSPVRVQRFLSQAINSFNFRGKTTIKPLLKSVSNADWIDDFDVATLFD